MSRRSSGGFQGVVPIIIHITSSFAGLKGLSLTKAGLIVVGLRHEDQALDGDEHLVNGGALLFPVLALGAFPRAQQVQTNLRKTRTRVNIENTDI